MGLCHLHVFIGYNQTLSDLHVFIGYNQTQEFSAFDVNYDGLAINFRVNLHILIIFHAKIAEFSEQIITDN